MLGFVRGYLVVETLTERYFPSLALLLASFYVIWLNVATPTNPRCTPIHEPKPQMKRSGVCGCTYSINFN